MRVIATLGNEHKVVAIGTYCDNLPLIAMNVVVAIDPNPCSECCFLPSGNSTSTTLEVSVTPPDYWRREPNYRA
jgi:hypothetical protein